MFCGEIVGMEEERSNRKRKRPRRRKNRAENSSINPKHTENQHQKEFNKTDGSECEDSAAPPAANRRVSSSFLDKMRAKLSGGHFRMINEKLYTCTGSEALDYFKEDPALFNVDFSNKMFILLYFKKKEKQNLNRGEIEWPELKPCLYKRR